MHALRSVNDSNKQNIFIASLTTVSAQHRNAPSQNNIEKNGNQTENINDYCMAMVMVQPPAFIFKIPFSLLLHHSSSHRSLHGSVSKK